MGETPDPSQFAQTPRHQHLRIEALRAAAQAMSSPAVSPGRSVKEQTLMLAEKFAKWLETGER